MSVTPQQAREALQALQAGERANFGASVAIDRLDSFIAQAEALEASHLSALRTSNEDTIANARLAIQKTSRWLAEQAQIERKRTPSYEARGLTRMGDILHYALRLLEAAQAAPAGSPMRRAALEEIENTLAAPSPIIPQKPEVIQACLSIYVAMFQLAMEQRAPRQPVEQPEVTEDDYRYGR